MTIQASKEVIQLLDKLFKDWAAWDQNRYYYIHTLLPELKAHPDRGTTQEKAILRELNKLATEEEWSQLEAIAEDLTNQQKKIHEISKILDHYIDQYDFNGAEAYILENGDSGVQRLFESKKRIALGKSWHKIISALSRFEFEEAEFVMKVIKPYLSDEDLVNYKNHVTIHQKILVDKTLLEIREACARYNYDLAEAYYSRIAPFFPRIEFIKLIEEAKQGQAADERARFVTTTIRNIQQLLEHYDFIAAEEKYVQVKDEYSKEAYLKLVQTYKKKQARENYLLSLRVKLEADDYPAADKLFRSSGLIDYQEYLRIKSPYVQKFVQKHYSKTINLEKAEALASTSPNLLISARAGSGKTMVLASKASLLIECEQVHPDHVLVMAFNRSAADEIRNRIRRDYKQLGFDNARTFHSLAHQLVRPTEDLLYDERDDVITRKMSLFVQQLLKEQIRNPVFIEKMYAIFRKEMREIERTGFLLDEESYFDFRRNLFQVTLNGERVKSVGEKIIADFLFEHDISYVYEKVWLWSSQIYRPDFSVYEQQKDYVIEFWGIDENDPANRVPPEWSRTWDEYHAEMQAKRAFWNEKSAVLIETSIRDLRNGREAFEAILTSKLAKAGIKKPKLTSDELKKKIQGKDYTITHLSDLFTQFIQRAKKQVLKAEDVQKLLQSYQPKDDREAAFLDLACRVYMEYERELTRQHKIDFDDLMIQAINKVHETRGECEITLGNSKSRNLRMNDLRWILIDEYQDFSELFYRLITAIQKYNPQVQIFCVGDDWQAINGFAGSDLQFFNRFEELVKDAQVTYLLTNFRSQAAIVRAGNALMQGCGRPGEHLPQNSGGDVQIGYMDDIWIELRNNDASINQKTDDERFLIIEAGTNGNDNKYNRIVASKYLKQCYQIITSPENWGKSVAILSRTNWIDGVRLNEFKNKLIASLTPTDLKTIEDPKNKIHVQTAHKFKGLEADLVIILGACNGMFPLLHPDNALFEIFGKTLLDAFEEERRLFYVALTRAKSRLYILTEKGRESVFLKRLPGYQPSQSGYTWHARSSQFVSPLFASEEEDIPF